MMVELLKPAEAAKVLKMSTSTITRNKKAGAPVHYISTKRRFYLIDPEEFLAWINSEAAVDQTEKERVRTIYELKTLRKSMCG